MGQVQVVEKVLDEVFLGDHVLQELLWSLDQPEGEDLVKVATQGRVQEPHLVFQMGVWLLVERNELVHQDLVALFLLL